MILRDFCSQKSWDCLVIWSVGLSDCRIVGLSAWMTRGSRSWVALHCFPFDRISMTWHRDEYMRLWSSFFWFESCVFPFQEVVCHPASRWSRNLSINKIKTHQGRRNIATLGAQPNGGFSRGYLTSGPFLPVLPRSVCDGSNKFAL
jgi:hypothetical protein